MNFKKILFAITMVTLVCIGCKNDPKKEIKEENKQEITKADTKEFAMNISGMTCEVGCAKYIQSKLSKQEGVLDAKVVFTDSIATVKYDASKTNKASLVSLVNGLADNMYKASENSAKKACATDCKEECCKDNEVKACDIDCKKSCCTEKKACTAVCSKECCTIVQV